MKRNWVISVVAGLALALLSSGRGLAAQAQLDVFDVLTLNNCVADSDVGCPTDGAAYWHFVVPPGNGTSTFLWFDLNLGDPTLYHTSTFAPNAGQLDSVWVMVPDGHLLTDLRVSNPDGTMESTAEVHFIGRANQEPSKFVLSSVCGGTPVPEPGTMTLLGTGLVGLAGIARRRAKK